MPTPASNQFAVRVEDSSGTYIKTIYVTDFTAGRRGYQNRDTSLLHWTAAANPNSLSDSDIDTISGATPPAGTQSFYWDMTDSDEKRVEDGIYQLNLFQQIF